MSSRQPTGNPNWTLIAMCFGLFMVMLDATIVNTALPTIQRELDMSTTELQWINNAYTLVIGVLVITAGRAGDLYGRRRFFLAGVVIFACSSAAAGAAQSDVWLITARGFEGIGAAAMIPLSLSIVNATFPPAERGRAIGIWAGVSALALAIGPLLGGVLTEEVSWRAIFYVNVPVGVAAVFMTRWAVRESHGDESGKIDYPGIALVSLGLLGIVLGAMEGRTWGWGSAATIGCFAGGVALLGVFVLVERGAASPLLDLALFRIRTFVGSNIAAFLISFGMLGVLFFIPLYLQNVRGYTPIESGAAMLPMTAMITVTAPIAGRIADRVGSRIPMVVGFLFTGLAFFLLGELEVSSGYGSIWPAFVIAGIGMGLVMTPMSTAVMASVPQTETGVASGTANMSRQIGGTFGIATLGAAFSVLLQSKLSDLLASSHSDLPPDEVLGGHGSNPDQAVAKIKQLPPNEADPILDAARDAFVYALANTFRIAAVVCAAGAVVAAVMISRRTEAKPEPPAPVS